MTWTTPRTWNPGERVTAAQLNVHLRDNLNALRYLTVVSPDAVGAVNDWDPGLRGHTLIRCNNATALTITGLANGQDGQRVIIVSVGAGHVHLSNEAAGSAAGNRLNNWVTSAGATTILLAGAGSAEFVYDGITQRWRMLRHTMGGFLDVTYNAGQFLGSGAMTWTVEAADVWKNRFTVRENMVFWRLVLGSTVVGGTVSTNLQAYLPYGTSIGWGGEGTYVLNNSNGAMGISGYTLTPDRLNLYRDIVAVTNWSLGATCAIRGTFIYEVG